MRLGEYRESLVNPNASFRTRLLQNAAAVGLRVFELIDGNEDRRMNAAPAVQTIEMPWHQQRIQTVTELDELMAQDEKWTTAQF
jgi:hypothetical protein